MRRARRNKITFAPSPLHKRALLPAARPSLRQLASHGKEAPGAPPPADVLRRVKRSTDKQQQAPYIGMCNAKTIAEATLPAGTFAAAAAAVATASESAAAAVAQASESAAAAAADARYTTEESGARVGKSLLRLYRNIARRGTSRDARRGRRRPRLGVESGSWRRGRGFWRGWCADRRPRSAARVLARYPAGNPAGASRVRGASAECKGAAGDGVSLTHVGLIVIAESVLQAPSPPRAPPRDPPCTFFDDGWALHPSVACSRKVRPDFFRPAGLPHTNSVAFRSVGRACSRSLARCDKLGIVRSGRAMSPALPHSRHAPSVARPAPAGRGPDGDGLDRSVG